jgi:alkylated DNA repair dioxygenase AlkB
MIDDLFSEVVHQAETPNIPGMAYYPNYIDALQETDLLKQIDQGTWQTDLKRRVQHYGYRYDYRARLASLDDDLGPLPSWVLNLVNRLWQEQIFDRAPDQVIVNEYVPGQGISAHIDCVPCFGPVVASLSLGGACMMEFSNSNQDQKAAVYLAPCSLLVLSGAARDQWRHEIKARKSDMIAGLKTPRLRRVSLTFRTMKFSEE